MMSRQQLQDSEAAAVPDEAMLATVLNYLKNKGLKDTEVALRKELSNHIEDDATSFQVSTGGQSGTEPLKYEESYTSSAPFSPTISTTTACPLANDNSPASNQASKHSTTIPLIVPSLQTTILNSQANTDVGKDGDCSEPTTPIRKFPSLFLPSSASKALNVEMPSSERENGLLTTANAVVSSSTLDKNPLWFRDAITSTSSSTDNNLPSTSINRHSPSPPSVHTPISLTQPFGGSTMIMQNAPNASAVSTSGVSNLTIRAPLMYQLAGSSCVSNPIIAPILTVLPPTSNLFNPSCLFLANNSSQTTSSNFIQSLTPKTSPQVSMPQNQFVGGVSVGGVSSKTLNKEAFNSVSAEPSTGQHIPNEMSSPLSGFPLYPRTLASILPSELTPQHLELKAFAEDFKTRRIRLGFTQGAVGQSLAERGYSNFAQSTISRFEQMQLSPSNAATIRVILEKWLLEAESPESASSSSSNVAPVMAGRKRKKRAVFTPQTKSILDEFFTQNPRPNRHVIEDISQKLDLLPEEVRVWFCNKRQKSKSYQIPGHRSSIERDSSDASPSSPPVQNDGGLTPKRRTPSPPKTSFTIEELSKSSTYGNTTATVSSPLHLSSPSISPVGLVTSISQSKVFPMLFNPNASPTPLLNNPLMTQFIVPPQVSQTRA